MSSGADTRGTSHMHMNKRGAEKNNQACVVSAKLQLMHSTESRELV